MITVRSARPDDAATIAEFNRTMAWETERLELDASTIQAGVTAVCDNPSRGFYVVAESGEAVVACLLVTFEWSDWRNGVFWWIQSVYVLPDFRRQGVYRRMYEMVQQLARDDDSVCGFRLYVERDNERAQATYETLGMQATHYLMFEGGPPNPQNR